MAIATDEHLIDEVINRSVAEIYPSKDAFQDALRGGKRLTFYVGIDPTADYVHLGHSTNYLLLERLHSMGHRIIVLVGDFTAMIGDPSDKSAMRVQLTRDQVKENLVTFKEQIGKILDFTDTSNPIEFKFNSDWLANLSFQDSVELASNFTVQQMVERDAFKKRIDQRKPLFVHEFFYPLMQGYDSVAMEVDAEIGGTDQTFNMLAGRVLLKRYKNKEKFVIATTLLENPETGEKMMSKSLGTGIALNEDPKNMFFKTMQLPDAGIIQCFIDCTRKDMQEINELRDRLKDGTNPRDVKLQLAYEIVKMYHGSVAAETAQNDWIAQVSKKEVSTDLPTLRIIGGDLLEAIVNEHLFDSKSKVRRLMNEGAVKINGVRVDLDTYTNHLAGGAILSIGKKHTFVIEVA
ncbi:MAG: tyrosine--tRNA ligase [Candidatus Saccharimonas sp.]